MRKSQVLNIIILFIISMSCSNTSRLEQALDFAGSNRPELEIVLAHYKNDVNPLKLRAAEFLIENMPYYYSYQENESIDSLKKIKIQYKNQKKRIGNSLIDTWKHVSYSSIPKIYDVHVITADYLIKNIDFSFQVWEACAWNKYYSFDEFCEYILPYRIKDEPLEEWKSIYYNKYKSILDSIYQGSDVVEAARNVANYLKSEKYENQKDWELPHLGALYLFKHRLGTCREACDISLYTMRSLGIPISVDEYIISPNYRGNHFWTSIIDTTKKAVPFIFHEKELNRSFLDDRNGGKLYRTYFGAQPEKINGIYTSKDVSSIFRNPFYKDVSSSYFSNQFEVEISNDKNHKYAYLSVFTIDGWQPIDIAKAKRKNVTFLNVENNLIYQTVFSESGKIIDAGYPFLLVDSKPIYFIPDTIHKSDIILKRKYPETLWLKKHLISATGVKIEMASKQNLEDAVTLLYVKDTLKTIYNYIYPDQGKTCQYLIYSAPSRKKIELAELLPYKDTLKNEIHKSLISAIPKIRETDQKMINSIIDQDISSFYTSSNRGEKLILDFQKQVVIEKILFAPRNDDNYIHIGEIYELFFHAGIQGWVSLGEQIAEREELNYKKVPSNALFWLRNKTKGREEQVFYYEKGRQIFAYDL